MPPNAPDLAPSAARTNPDELAQQVVDLALAAGCRAVGLAPADVFEETRAELHERKVRGLHGGMQFTYRNPERSTDPSRVVPGARALVVAAWDYRHRGGSSVGGGAPGDSGRRRPTGQVAEYARRDHYGDLRAALGRVAERLRREGWRAEVVCDDNALVDRAAAHRAGMGWFGKNSLLLLPGVGSRVVLGSVVTDAPLAERRVPAPLAHGEGCGSCRRCQAACPTGALDEAGVVDARRCVAWLLQASGPFPVEHRAALGDRIYGCDECQRACPVNRRVDRRDEPRPAEPDVRTDVDLLELLAMDDEDLLDRFGRWYVAGRDPRYLRRNALVVLGNVGDPGDAATRRALARWADGPDDLLAEHARWAAAALGVDTLAPAPAPCTVAGEGRTGGGAADAR